MTTAPPQTLRQYLSQLYDDSCDTAGHVDLGKVETEAVAYLTGHPDLLDLRKLVHSHLQVIDRERRPNFESFFQTTYLKDLEHTYLPIGPNLRVRTDLMQPNDFDAWWLIQVEEHATSVQAHQVKTTVYMRIKRAWKPGHRTLAEVWQTCIP